VAIAVDAVVGVEEVVVRSLPPMLHGHELFAGVTLSGNAETVLLFDVPRLVESALKFVSDLPLDAAGTVDGRDSRHAAGNPRRVLVVDDSPTARRHLVRKLESRGLQTAQACDGLEALDRLRAEEFIGVVTDLEMPRMTGSDFLTEVKLRARSRGLPVVVVTSRTDPSTIEGMRKLGAEQVFAKPVTDEALAQIIAALEHVSAHSRPTGVSE
jgi:chemosensory pili system protein ChpA (sensor histidine kinase/response regulator)